MDSGMEIQEKVEDIAEAIEEAISVLHNTKVALEATEEEASTIKSVGAAERLLKCIREKEIGSLKGMFSP